MNYKNIYIFARFFVIMGRKSAIHKLELVAGAAGIPLIGATTVKQGDIGVGVEYEGRLHSGSVLAVDDLGVVMNLLDNNRFFAECHFPYEYLNKLYSPIIFYSGDRVVAANQIHLNFLSALDACHLTHIEQIGEDIERRCGYS